MLYVAGIFILTCLGFLGYIIYCDISVNKKLKEKEKTKE
jgi:hypothetical protein